MLTRIIIIILLFTACNRSKVKSNTESSYYPTGELRSEKRYHSDSQWEVIEYYKTGKIASKADYFNGKIIGTFVFFYPNGKKNFEQNFDSMERSDGMLYLWYENGNLKQIGENTCGKMIGEWKNYFEDGQLMSVENYREGKKNGKWSYFNNQGDTVKIEWYRNDSLVNHK